MQISKNISKYTVAFLGLVVIFSSCKKEYESIESIDEAKIQAYIQKNNIPAIKDPSGFYYQVLTQGTGGPLLNKDSVFYNFTVTSLTGVTYYSPTAYANEGNYLGYVTPASYRTALYAINRGGKVRVIVPSYLAFGKNGQGNIPPNEVIVSEITVFDATAQWQVDDNRIKDFLTEKALTGFTKHSSRVYRNISVVGTGPAINEFSTITFKYKGRLLNGTVFDETTTANLTTTLDGVIRGWRSLVGITKGSKVRIFIPSDLGYGVAANGAIPGNSILDFDIEVVDVVN
jgi:FKBP-type peptidyl-prolyl cis-trans isomerase FkpA